MKKARSISRILNIVANYLELMISFILICVIAVLLVDIVLELRTTSIMADSFDFEHFLSRAMSLIIGIEFTRMLCRHTPDTIIEVLVFATARQLIVEHTGAINTLFGVLSIGVLFALRKYMLPNVIDKDKLHLNKLFKKNEDEDDGIKPGTEGE